MLAEVHRYYSLSRMVFQRNPFASKPQRGGGMSPSLFATSSTCGHQVVARGGAGSRRKSRGKDLIQSSADNGENGPVRRQMTDISALMSASLQLSEATGDLRKATRAYGSRHMAHGGIFFPAVQAGPATSNSRASRSATLAVCRERDAAWSFLQPLEEAAGMPLWILEALLRIRARPQ